MDYVWVFFYFLFVPGKTIAGVVHRARLFEFFCHLLISTIENAIVLLIKKAQLEKGARRDSGRMWSSGDQEDFEWRSPGEPQENLSSASASY